MLFADFTDEHAVVSAATVLKKDGEDLPHIRDQRVLLLCVLQTFLHEFVKTD